MLHLTFCETVVLETFQHDSQYPRSHACLTRYNACSSPACRVRRQCPKVQSAMPIRRTFPKHAGTGRASGLTLIELLIAITVLAVVAVLGWRGLDSIVRSRIALTEEMERTRGIQLAFAQMERDAANVATAVLSPDRPPLAAGGGRLVFIRRVFTENQPVRLQVVSYRIGNGVLYRRESIPTRDLGQLDLAWQANGAANGEQEVALEDGVDSMSLRVWASNANTWQTVDVNSPQMFPSTTNSAAAQAAQLAQANQAVPATSSTSAATQLSGLEVSLQMTRADNAKMIKVFLLGAS
jgi:general secretion pathway protein J